MSNYIFTLLGTGGDVWPGIAIAAELHDRGHDVVVLSYDYFADEAEQRGVSFVSVGDTKSYLAHITTASFWERHGTSKGLDEGGYLRQAVAPVYDYIVSRLSENPFLICTRNAYGARFAAENFGCPLLCLTYSSTQFASAEEFPYSAPRLAQLPLWMRRISMRLGDQLYNQPLLKKINPIRESYNLPPVRHMRRWSFFGTPSLALFPEWYHSVKSLAQYDIIQGGFVFARTDETVPLSPDVSDFLAAGEAPVLFTFGTGVGHVREVFSKAVDALNNIGMRGIFVTKFSENIPENLQNVLTIPYADFSALLPKMALVVHHGGIGTAAQTLRAGVPQVIVPLAFDQPDNAYRLKTLGLGEFVHGMEFKTPELEQAILRAIECTSQEKLSELRKELLHSDGRSSAADHCEEFFMNQEYSYVSAAV